MPTTTSQEHQPLISGENENASRTLRPLTRLIGREVQLEDVARALSEAVRDLNATLVGALHVSCSDEVEGECREVYRRRFAVNFLPSTKYSNQSPFVTCNLGGRYEWGSARVAEQHFFSGTDTSELKLMVVKINSHVAVSTAGQEPEYGRLHRYGSDSHCCGALHAAFDGRGGPWADELRKAFNSDGPDRITALRTSPWIQPERLSLYAALVNARLQALRCIVDIQDSQPQSPTIFIVLPCVTVNRIDRDTEILCGHYLARAHEHGVDTEYRGLGTEVDNTIDIALHGDRVTVTGAGINTSSQVSTLHHSPPPPLSEEHPEMRFRTDPKILPMLDQITATTRDLRPYAPVIAKALKYALAEMTPVAAAMFLFGEGLLEVHQIRALQRADDNQADSRAEALLKLFVDTADTMPPNRLQQAFTTLRDICSVGNAQGGSGP